MKLQYLRKNPLKQMQVIGCLSTQKDIGTDNK